MFANIVASTLGYCLQKILVFYSFNSFTVKVKMFGMKFGGKSNYFSPMKLMLLEKQTNLGDHKKIFERSFSNASSRRMYMYRNR